MQQEPTTPNLARVYDYMLDGTHNFAVDREVGEMNKRNRPVLVKFVKLNRDFLELAGRQFVRAEADAYIDLATGLPTEGALHELVPETAKIIYNDHDPYVITYGTEILAEYTQQRGRTTANIRWVQSKIQDIDRILAEAEEFFGAERRVGISLIGVAYFIDDDSLRRVCQRLYDWSAPGSMLAVTSFNTHMDDSGWAEILEQYRKMGVDGFPRSPEHLQTILTPWQGSFQPLETIIEADLGTQVAEPSERGKMGYGGIFTR